MFLTLWRPIFKRKDFIVDEFIVTVYNGSISDEKESRLAEVLRECRIGGSGAAEAC